MSGEIEADGIELVAQFFHARPVGNDGQAEPFRLRQLAAEQIDLPAFPIVGGSAGLTQQQLGGFKRLPTVGVERIEGAGGDQVFQGALVKRPGIAPAGEIGEALEGACRLALRDDRLGGT